MQEKTSKIQGLGEKEMEKTKLLIVDDDEGILKQLKWALCDEYEVYTASTKEEAVESFLKNKPPVVTLDVNLSPNMNSNTEGIEILEAIKNIDSLTKVVMVTANDAREIGLSAIDNGAFDYFLKPVRVEELKIMLKRALYIQNLEKENQILTTKLNDSSKFEDMVGTSAKMQDVFSMIRRVAPTDATVFITGESGTGKELVARATHYLSLRKEKPFIVINCGAIPENLLESELFGHEKGAFTDAHTKRIGKLEAASGGTVFLDEIGDMSLSLQVKLLRFLQDRVIERVGGNASIELDVRVIAATNCDVRKKIKEGGFREDLYYRLSVIAVELPPVRERGDDVELLANYFLHKYKQQMKGKTVKGFSRQTKAAIKSYAWPGNVREMENRIKRAFILAENGFIKPFELGLGDDKDQDLAIDKFSLKEARRHIEVRYIQRALGECKGNVSLAAKMLGITRPTLYDLLKKYDISV
jgi:two-component system, NtrC family, response regulator